MKYFEDSFNYWPEFSNPGPLNFPVPTTQLLLLSLQKLRCSGTSKRSTSNPLGEEQYESVRNGNILCVRTLIIAMIAASLGSFIVIEQPKGSWMQEHPCFQEFITRLNIWRHHISMGDYGAETQKPTWLYASLFDPDSNKVFWYFTLLLRRKYGLSIQSTKIDDHILFVWIVDMRKRTCFNPVLPRW